MRTPPEMPHIRVWGRRSIRGLTIVECLLATAILGIVGIAMVFTLTAGRARFEWSSEALRAVRLGEHLLEEAAARPYSGTGTSRATWCLDDFDGFADGPGQVTDFLGDEVSQGTGYRRTISVAPAVTTFAELNGFAATGKTVVVRVESPNATLCELVRFIPEPLGP